ncbi:MAG: InlB B-repeat-containing protein [Clostridia bacterium]|nr:InlB B-repeat-containing protein [Clostridia bacterium]
MKKTLAFIVAIAMMFTVLSVSAFAATDDAVKYTLIYLSNSKGGGVGAGLQVKDLVDGQEVTVGDQGNYYHQNATMEFSHWTDKHGNIYYPGDTFVVNAEDANALKKIILTAQWVYVPGVLVIYDKNTDDPNCTGNLHGSTSAELPKGSEYTISSISSPIAGLSYPLHKLVEWNTAADGTGTSYQPGDVVTVNETFTLYAIWENVEKEVVFYTVTFDANGGEGEMAPETDIPENGSITAPFCDFTYEGYNFVGWNTAADGSGDLYEEWDDVTVLGDLTLYAMWEVSDAWDFNPLDGELTNIAIAIAVSTVALSALYVIKKKELED